MASRVCNSIFRASTRVCGRVTVLARQGNVSSDVGTKRYQFNLTPVCFISSEAFLKKFRNSKAAEAGSRLNLPSLVPTDSGEQMSLLLKHPDQPENSRVLKVAIIGAPNAGKSTLSNQLIGRKVFAVSKKVHTTRTRALGVITEDDTQIVILDTPGFTTPVKVKKHQLEKSLLLDPWYTVKEADLIVAMVDVSDKWTCNKLDTEVIKCLALHSDIPAVLILNKVDQMKLKSRLLDITAELTIGVVNGRRIQVGPATKFPCTDKRTVKDDRSADLPLLKAESRCETSSKFSPEHLKSLRNQRGWPHFRDVFMLSSVDREDVDALKHYLMLAARPGAWLYHSEVLTDQSPEQVCNDIVREKLLEYLPQEVPYTMTQSIDFWQDNEDGVLEISMKLYTKKESHLRMVIGATGQMVGRMAHEAGNDLSRLFLKEVKLKLSVKMAK